jgi:hypothetical protein
VKVAAEEWCEIDGRTEEVVKEEGFGVEIMLLRTG